MEAEELMIGDWVMMKPFPDSEPMPNQIVGIEYNSWEGADYCDWVNCKEWDELSLNEIEPIPLTKEILEKNGWPRRRWKHHLEDVFSDSNGEPTNNLIALWPYEDSFVLIIRGEECSTQHIETFDIRKRIRYVHELQHALRLCEISKEIEL